MEEGLRQALLAPTSRALCLPSTADFTMLSLRHGMIRQPVPSSTDLFDAHALVAIPCDQMCPQARELNKRLPSLGRCHSLHRFVVRQDIAAEINQQLVEWVLQREAGGTEVAKTNVGGWQSHPTCFDNGANAPCLHRLHVIASAAMDELQGARNDDAPLHPCDAWANVNRAGDYNSALAQHSPVPPNLSPSHGSRPSAHLSNEPSTSPVPSPSPT